MGTTASVIRLLTGDDLDGAFGLSAAAGWNQRLADWRMLLRLAPAGSFAAVDDGRIVGTAIGIDYGAFGWIAMMLVDERGRLAGEDVRHVLVLPERRLAAGHVADPADAVDDGLVVTVAWMNLEKVRVPRPVGTSPIGWP